MVSLVEAEAGQYTAPGLGDPILLVHVATAPNAMRHVLPALPTELWPPSLAATWAACAAITVAYAPAQPHPARPDAAEPVIELDELHGARRTAWRRTRHQADRHRSGRLRR